MISDEYRKNSVSYHSSTLAYPPPLRVEPRPMSSKQLTDTAHTVTTGATEAGFDEILTEYALAFITAIESQFGERRRELLTLRSARQLAIDAGQLPRFLPETADVRTGDSQVLSGRQSSTLALVGSTEEHQF